MTTIEDLHEVVWNDSGSEPSQNGYFYQFNINKTLSPDEIKVVESAIAKVLDNKEIEEESY